MAGERTRPLSAGRCRRMGVEAKGAGAAPSGAAPAPQDPRVYRFFFGGREPTYASAAATRPAFSASSMAAGSVT